MSSERPDLHDSVAPEDGGDEQSKPTVAPLFPVQDRESTETPEADPEDEFDLDSSEYYLNRELTWLEFNWRVLHEAEDPRTPLLERAKFLAIVNSNLDEFIMKRIGGLKQQVGAGMHDRNVDGRTPREQIAECLLVTLAQNQH